MLPLQITCTCHQAKIAICCQTPQVTPIAPKFAIVVFQHAGSKFALRFAPWPLQECKWVHVVYYFIDYYITHSIRCTHRHTIALLLYAYGCTIGSRCSKITKTWYDWCTTSLGNCKMNLPYKTLVQRTRLFYSIGKLPNTCNEL